MSKLYKCSGYPECLSIPDRHHCCFDKLPSQGAQILVPGNWGIVEVKSPCVNGFIISFLPVGEEELDHNGDTP